MESDMTPVLEPQLGSTKDKALACFFARYKYKVQISKLSRDLQIVLPFTVSTADKKLIFVKNSKVACTSITHLLYEYSYEEKFTGNIHRDGLEFHHGLFWWEINKQLLESSNTTIFSIVRNPETRCVSAFKNFFVDRNNSSAKKHLKAIAKFGYHVNSSIESNFDSFLDYIEASQQADPFQVDRHWREQHINLGVETVKYSHIGKLENLLEDMHIIFDLAGLDKTILNQLNRRRNSTRQSELLVSPQQLTRIKCLYAKDYDIFGYG